MLNQLVDSRNDWKSNRELEDDYINLFLSAPAGVLNDSPEQDLYVNNFVKYMFDRKDILDSIKEKATTSFNLTNKESWLVFYNQFLLSVLFPLHYPFEFLHKGLLM